MLNISIKVEEDYLNKFLEFIKTLPKDKVELDEKTLFDNSIPEIKESEEDKLAYESAMKDLKKGEVYTMEDVWKERKDV